jgi:hypothetical protein
MHELKHSLNEVFGNNSVLNPIILSRYHLFGNDFFVSLLKLSTLFPKDEKVSKKSCAANLVILSTSEI